MGTRALINVIEDGKDLLCVYRQFDGYPEGLGADIQKILGGRILVNGFQDGSKECNDMGCLAAMLVAGLKEGCGNVYIYPAGSKECGEEYTYTLYKGELVEDRTAKWPRQTWPIMLKVESETVIYDGPLASFDPKAKEAEIA